MSGKRNMKEKYIFETVYSKIKNNIYYALHRYIFALFMIDVSAITFRAAASQDRS